MRQMGLDSAEVEEDGILKVVYQGRQIRLAAFGVHWKGRSLVLGAPTWFSGFAALLLSSSIPCLLSLIQDVNNG